MVSKTAIVGVLSVIVILQCVGFIYLYTKPRAGNSSNTNSVRYLLISKSLNLARRTLGLNDSDEPPAEGKLKNNQVLPTKSINTGTSNSSKHNSTNGQQNSPSGDSKQHSSLNTSNAGAPSFKVNTPKDKDAHQKPLHTWKQGSFCHDFLVKTFHDSVPACGKEAKPTDSIKCYGNTHSNHMARCALENVAIKPSKLAAAMFEADTVHFSEREDSIQILDDKDMSCPNPTSQAVSKRMENGDYVRVVIETVVKGKKVSSNICQKWIDKTAFFFTGHPFHIYFRFLDYYNLHKALSDYNLHEEEYDIIRVSTGTSEYHYASLENKLFPNMMHISDLPDVVTCYKRVVLVPKSYASTLFQCKMHWSLKDHCLSCDGKGLSDTDLQTFRKRVVRACSLDDERHHKDSRLVLISRKPYIRSPTDELRKFERVLSNEGDLVKGIQSTFPSTNVTVTHLEDLPICDQVLYANQADVLLAVHGAGLVHLWWLREDALAVEMEPHYEAGNPSFKVLSKLTGRKYQSHFIGGGWGTVNVNVNDVLKILSSHSTLQ